MPTVFPAVGAVSRGNIGQTVSRDDDVDLSRSVNLRGEKTNGDNRSVNSRVTNKNSVRGNVVSRSGDTAVRSQSESGIVRTVLSRQGDTNVRKSRVATKTSDSNVQRSGIILRPTNTSFGVRSKNTNVNSGRVVSSRVATKKLASVSEISKAKEILEQTASLNKSCQDQYNECMDQFCAVVDTNQKRCSCSANLAQYARVESAVKDANSQLNDVAQRIRYVGLSADEIRAIMNATEAEEAIDKNKDTSETRNMLDDIEKLIKDPTVSSSYTSSDNNMSLLDIDLDFSSESSDIFSLDFLNGSGDNISNKRGSELYKTATKRCRAILDNCTDVGATESQITGNYELAIDKDCIAYEQGLKKMNDTLLSNVRSANLMLQKARLTVMQNKNQYDAKGCVGALETCMTDEMVCGADYSKCLDPTKKYIDENGSVVYGQNITKITDFMSGYDNTAITSDKLSNVAGLVISDSMCSNTANDGSCIMKYLLTKIGTGTSYKDGGLCRAVLDKCQVYTYKSDQYVPYNDIVVNYVQRAMVNIKSAQQKIISDYASDCMKDVATCYNQQVSQINSWTSVSSASSIKAVMTGACRSIALTCGYAVLKNACFNSEGQFTNWINMVAGGDGDGTSNSGGCSSGTTCDESNPQNCINGISEIFYQSLLCPDNSTYYSQCSSSGTQNNRDKEGCVNTQCMCDNGYTVWSGACVPSCSDTEYRDSLGMCAVCPADKIATGGDNNKENNICSNPSETENTNADEENSDENTCPDNSTYDDQCVSGGIANDMTIGGCVSAQCRCDSNYTVWSGACVPSCSNTQYRDLSGACAVCPVNKNASGGGDNTEHNACSDSAEIDDNNEEEEIEEDVGNGTGGGDVEEI